MGLKRIFTLGFQLPDKEFEYISFDSMASLLDADIVLIKPTLIYKTDYLSPTFQGKPSLSEDSSNECLKCVDHWRSQLKDVVDNGKIVFVFLKGYEEVYYKTGRKEYSGTGRNARVTNIVDTLDSYGMLPLDFKTKKIAKGKEMVFTNDANFLKPYWEVVKSISAYEVYFEIDKIKPTIKTKTGEKIVSGMIKSKSNGHMLLLPSFDFPDSFYDNREDGTYWSKNGFIFSKVFLSQIIAIEKHLKSNTDQTPPPDWINDDAFLLEEEKRYLDEIVKIEAQISKLREKISDKKDALKKVNVSKGLLYETGKALEYAIIDALKIIGFKAENYDDGKSEFDMVFESAEGRFIGEAEGKDTSAIHVTKYRQLETNLNEDFARDEVAEHAKGILFGNPHRLMHPKDRKECFTDKVMQSAKRTGIALVNTYELFEVVKYLKKTKDKTYAKKVRECFRKTEGEVIKFPLIPDMKMSDK